MAAAAAQPYAQVMEDMRKGQELAARLQGLLADSPDAGRLVDQILHAMSRTIETARAAAAAEEGSEGQSEVTCAGTGGGKRKAAGGGDKRTACRRRAHNSSTVTVTIKDIEDGHAWRKYGQKEIQNSKHPKLRQTLPQCNLIEKPFVSPCHHDDRLHEERNYLETKVGKVNT